jgi:hypothetical protein
MPSKFVDTFADEVRRFSPDSWRRDGFSDQGHD